MSTNYYLIDKTKLEQDRVLSSLIEEIKHEDIEKDINKVVLKRYDSIIKYLEQNVKNSNKIENFKGSLSSYVEQFDSNLRYNLDYILLTGLHELKHIGKLSMGWLFCFHYQPEWKNYKEFKTYITTKLKDNNLIIVDEYWNEVSPEELIDLIERKQNDPDCLANPDNFTYNDNVDGYRFADGDWS